MTFTDQSNKMDIIIAGGGISGLTAALLFARKGFDVCVLEPFPLPSLDNITPGNHTSALMNGSTAVLEQTGAWKDCAPYIAPLETLRIIDDSTSTKNAITADFHADEIAQDQFGMNVPNNVLRAALVKQVVATKNITVHTAKLVSCDPQAAGISAALDNGETINAKLLVGADGRKSAVRNAVGIGCKEKDYDQRAIICRLDHTKPHNETSTEFHRPSGPFTLVPLPGMQSSLVWVDTAENIEQFMAMNKTAFRQAIQDRSNGVLGEITLQSDPEAWPLIRQKADRLTAPRTVLIAEAAHVIHPLGAQGLNLSLRDVETLVDIVMNAAKLGLDFGSQTILNKYETARRQDIQGRVWGTDGLTQLLCTNSMFIKTLRRRGLKAASTIPPLKKLLMREGLSPSTTSNAA